MRLTSSFLFAPLRACEPVHLHLPAASGADYTVNNTQSAMPGSNLYGTLEELRASGLLRANDTVVLHNDDSTLTGGLNLLINVQSDNTAAARTLDLLGWEQLPCFS